MVQVCVRAWLGVALAVQADVVSAFAPCGLLAGPPRSRPPPLARAPCGARPDMHPRVRSGRPLRPLQAFPSTEEAGDVSTLEEGMAINTWEHLGASVSACVGGRWEEDGRPLSSLPGGPAPSCRRSRAGAWC